MIKKKLNQFNFISKLTFFKRLIMF